MYVIQCLFTWNCKNMDGLLTTHQDETRPFLWIVPPIQFSQSKSQPATSRNARRPCVLRSGWGSIRRLCPQHKWGIPGRQLHYVPSSKIAQVTQRGLSETKSHGVCSFSLLNLITKVAIVGHSGIPKMDKPKWRTAGEFPWCSPPVAPPSATTNHQKLWSSSPGANTTWEMGGSGTPHLPNIQVLYTTFLPNKGW